MSELLNITWNRFTKWSTTPSCTNSTKLIANITINLLKKSKIERAHYKALYWWMKGSRSIQTSMKFWITISPVICCCPITKSRNQSWFSSYHYLGLTRLLLSKGLMETCSICTWEYLSQSTIISQHRQKGSLSIKAKLVHLIRLQSPTSQYMPLCSILFVHFHRNLRTSWKTSWLKTSSTIMISSYYFSSWITFTSGCKKLSMNIHGIPKNRWLFTSSNSQPHNCKIGTKVSIWPISYRSKTLMNSRSSILNTNFIRTLSKQLFKVQLC